MSMKETHHGPLKHYVVLQSCYLLFSTWTNPTKQATEREIILGSDKQSKKDSYKPCGELIDVGEKHLDPAPTFLLQSRAHLAGHLRRHLAQHRRRRHALLSEVGHHLLCHCQHSCRHGPQPPRSKSRILDPGTPISSRQKSKQKAGFSESRAQPRKMLKKSEGKW